MRRLLSYLFFIVVIAVLLTSAASFVIWKKLDAAFFYSLIKSQTQKLKKSGIEVRLKGLNVRKHFPYITIEAKTVAFSQNGLEAYGFNVKDTISIPKALISKLVYGTYAGVINASLISINAGNIKLKLKKPTIELFLNKDIRLSLKTHSLTTPYLTLNNLTAKAEIDKTNKTLTLQVKNPSGFDIDSKISLKGETPNIRANITTPYLDITPFRSLLSPHLKRFILSGFIKLKNIEIDGNLLNPASIKTGKIDIKEAAFRIDLKSSIFHIKSANIEIEENKLIALAKGNFEGITTDGSEFIVYRKKDYPMEMHLHLQGNANEYVRVFLEENIFSKDDLDVLGKTKNLKGLIRADIDIYEYKRRPRPYFDFDVKLYPKTVEFENSNIPGGWVKVRGFLRIQRITDGGVVKRLMLTFKDLNATTKTSNLKTGLFVLDIKPKLLLNGSFNLNISKEDLNFFLTKFSHKNLPFNIKKAHIKATINGSPSRFSFNTDISTASSINNIPLNLKAKGIFNAPLLKIEALTLKSIGNISFSGNIDMKRLNITSLSATFKKLKIETIASIINTIPDIKGTIDGKISLNKQNGKFFLNKGSISITDGKFKAIDNISADINSDGSMLYMTNCSFNLLNNQLLSYGRYNLNTKSGDLSIFGDVVNLNVKQLIKPKKTQNNTTVKLPHFSLKIKANILKLNLKDNKQTKDIGATTLNCAITPKSLDINIFSLPTKITATFRKKRLKINISDSALWEFFTQCKAKHSSINIKAALTSPKDNELNIKTLRGKINLTSRNGCIKMGSSSLNLFSIILNPFKNLTTKLNTQDRIDYKYIKGELSLNNGILKATDKNPIILDGNIEIFGYGKYNIISKNIDAYITFITFSTINKLVSKIPVVGWIIGGKEKSFTGLSFHVKGDINNPSIKPIPFKSLAKGIADVLKRTIMLPLGIFGVK
ncbi:AsmA-like C-terminal domain-containing protein [Hippea sp. KM1]|uniref:AsmA-like C-terminal domain-containing protein n=1 Tax=Hippea sp. KM1 TaxID=944481 RepID=UPI00046D0BD4|nr:AsmA-like C-terminal domain-containing protein [Hippea sp. KM1]